MAATNADYFTHVGSPGTATTLAAPGHTIAGTTFNVVSTTNWPTDTGVIFAVDTVTVTNGVEVRNVGSYTEWEGVVTSSTTISNATLRYGTDQNYSAGSTTRVYIPVSSSRENRLADGLLVAHNQDGSMITGLPLTSPKITTGLNDTNNNELFKVTATGAAVNELTIANAATGSGPTLSATGGDTNIDINLTPKGTGVLKVGGNTLNTGVWTTYTPTLTGITLGTGGTISGQYAILGKTVHYSIKMVLGTSGLLTGAPTFSLPTSSAAWYAYDHVLGTANAKDVSAATFYALIATWVSASVVGLRELIASGTYLTHDQPSATSPFTWAATDIVSIDGSYQAA